MEVLAAELRGLEAVLAEDVAAGPGGEALRREAVERKPY